MAANYLEQLIAEWYEYRGYFVRRNVLVGKRAKGGYECELDIVALHPANGHLVQLEPSMDTDSWAKREERYAKKFEAGRKYIPDLFAGLDLPTEIEQVAVLVYASKQNHRTLGGGKVLLARELLADIFVDLATKPLSTHAIPEHSFILRSFQFATEYRADIMSVWKTM